MRNLFLLVFLILLLRANVKSKELEPRGGQKCALLSSKIYCFGGIIKGSFGDDVLNSLDIYKNDGASLSKLKDQWEEVNPRNPTNIVIGRRHAAQAAADGVRFLIQGGYDNESKVKMEDQTIAYNSNTDTWDEFTNHGSDTDTNIDFYNGYDRQIYHGSAEYVPGLDGFAFYGGKEVYASAEYNFTTLDNQTLSELNYMNSYNITESLSGFYYFTLFNAKTNTWTTLSQLEPPNRYWVALSATYHPKTQKIFYIGGCFYTDEHPNFCISRNMSYVTTFNTITNTWSKEYVPGNGPTERHNHTATLLPNGDDILLYGGTDHDGKVMLDYCFTLNVPNMSWKLHNLSAPNNNFGPRSQHSAVLVNNSLFILFGYNVYMNPVNQLLILDVRNVSNLAFADKISAYDTAGKKNDSDKSSGSEKGLSTGVIAGVVAGCIIATALAILGLVYCLRKKAKQTQENKQEELLEVDWDRIDNHYKETNFPLNVTSSTIYQHQKLDIQQQQGQKNSTRQHISANVYSEANSNNTATSTSQPVLASAANNYQTKPNIAEPILPDIVKPSITTSPTKPDGSV
ncbi:hypothetical protein BD770DRAFT_439959 [Pilaira anomala]|nr:hypothetical protein BD770DRAFT_439959 [Pilaira anomala]